MKKLIVAKESGFCFGVKRAIDAVLSLRQKHPEKNIYTYGNLIHNPQEIERLEKQGIKPIENLKKEDNSILVIRSHGVSDKIIEKAKEYYEDVIDLTCPLVQKVQSISKDLEKNNYQVIVYGEPEHPEVQGIVGNLKNPIIIENKEQIDNLPFFEKIGLVSQTTQNSEQFDQIASILNKKCNEILVKNTICSATEQRQNYAKKVAEEVDLMIVIGGKNSGNTKRLYEICKKIQDKTFLIETALEIKPDWKKFENIGITAGASTPDWIIQEVIYILKKE
jgi:4-hydroxy-3-methylbut-2-enyl diphosphate reductase